MPDRWHMFGCVCPWFQNFPEGSAGKGPLVTYKTPARPIGLMQMSINQSNVAIHEPARLVHQPEFLLRIPLQISCLHHDRHRMPRLRSKETKETVAPPAAPPASPAPPGRFLRLEDPPDFPETVLRLVPNGGTHGMCNPPFQWECTSQVV